MDLRLGQCPKGWRGVVSGLSPVAELRIPWTEMERRLLEMGFVEGAAVEILHDGPIMRDPIAVRVDDITIALRRAAANSILVRAEE
ncbi:MAG: ferrous iron transport protein A [Telmatospirillum sp.]|nr:ferrous iron transport protein A [Telmatospirillum sp.]